MNRFTQWVRRLREFRRGEAREAEMDTEVRFHLEMEEAELIRSGLSPAAARRQARLAFGGVEQVKEAGRDARGARWLDDLRRDLVVGLRTLRRTPGYAAAVILTLGLGIGAAATIFSAVNGVLLRRLPYADPSRLLVIWDGLDWIGVPEAWLRGRDVIRLREETTRFAGFAVVRPGSAALTEPGPSEPEQVRLSRVSADFFDLLGSRPALGRLFRLGEDRVGEEPVVVLSHRLWLRRWGRDSSVVGRRIDLDGRAATVIGVLPPEFRFSNQSSLGSSTDPDLFVPYAQVLADLPRTGHSLAVVARVKPGVSVAAAKAELAALSARMDREEFEGKGFRFVAWSLQDRLVRAVRPGLLALLGAVGLLLAIMVANLAMLALTRTARREREFTVRAALGAGRWPLMRQLIAETTVTSLLGGAVGVGLAFLGVRGLLALAPSGLPRRDEVGVDFAVVGFVLLAATAIGVAIGLLPARHAATRDAATVLRTLSFSIGGRRSRGALVVIQIALSTVLLAGTGLLLVSVVGLRQVDPGFAASGVVTVEMRAVASRYPDRARLSGFYRTVIERLTGLPGVEAVGAGSAPPLSAGADQYPAAFPTSSVSRGQESDYETTDVVVTTPGYFRAMGITILEGREFAATDDSASQSLIIDETLARRFFPNGGAVGQPVAFGGDSTQYQVIGVARHARLYRMDSDDRGQIYAVHAAAPEPWMSVALRSTGDLQALGAAARAAVKEIDPNQPISRVITMTDVVAESLAERRLVAVLVAGFAIVALVLAAIGIYGTAASAVAERTREIGIRVALGAEPRRLVRLILARPVRLVLLGLVAGLAGAMGLAGLIRGLLYGVKPTDPATLGAVAVVVVVVAMVAAWIPARRAIRADPAGVLKGD